MLFNITSLLLVFHVEQKVLCQINYLLQKVLIRVGYEKLTQSKSVLVKTGCTDRGRGNRDFDSA